MKTDKKNKANNKKENEKKKVEGSRRGDIRKEGKSIRVIDVEVVFSFLSFGRVAGTLEVPSNPL